MRRTGHPRIDNGLHPVIIGSDEAGWGCMAGPLVVAAVALSRDFEDPWVEDSKDTSEAQREAVYDKYKGKVTAWVEVIEPDAFDRMKPWNALTYAHRVSLRRVIDEQSSMADLPLVVIDGNISVEHFAILTTCVQDIISLPKGDSLVAACSMASIFAKVTRDRMMVKLDAEYPGYGFAKHKGYVSPEHQAALERLGPCPIHRETFEPVAREIAKREATEPTEAWAMFDDEP